MNTEADEGFEESEKEEGLTEELVQIKETARLKSEMLVNIAQDLRSSLLLIQQPVSKLKTDVGDMTSEQQQAIKRLTDRVSRMGQIVDQLGDVGKVPVRHGKLEVTEVEMCSFLQRYVAFFESRADQKNIDLQAQLPDHEVVQTLDPDKLKEMLIILMSNAIRFAREGGKVVVALQDEVECIRLSVEDSGKGFTSEEVDALFYDPDFNNKGGNVTQGNTKVDVRLSVVKKLVELHDGKLTIESEVGEGSVFTITLPKNVRNAENLKEVNLQEASKEPGAVDPLSLLEEEKGTQAKLLVVEDNRDMREYMEALLNNEGLDVEVASNGAEALKQLSVIDPDLIISDIMMPEMDGFQFVEKLRNNPQNQLIPVIMISAKSEEEARIHGFKIGISDYLVKPFSERELIARVKNLLKQKLEREKYLDSSKEEMASDEQSLVKKLKTYIEDHITNETITIRELSQSVNKSRRQLYRDLKATTGFTPAEFVREVKLRKARQLLEKNRKITVAEVAYKVGYNTAAHFSKIFKKRFGRNPSEYK